MSLTSVVHKEKYHQSFIRILKLVYFPAKFITSSEHFAITINDKMEGTGECLLIAGTEVSSFYTNQFSLQI